MSVYRLSDLWKPYFYNMNREPAFAQPRFSSCHSPFVYTVDLMEDSLYFEFDHLYPSSVPIYLHRPFCLCPHHHRHYGEYILPLGQPPVDFLDAAANLNLIERAAAEPYVCGLGDRLAMLELDRNLGICFGAPKGKWKWAADIIGTKGNGFNRKYKCTVETKGACGRSIRWTVEYQGNGKYAPFIRKYKCQTHPATMRDVVESAKMEKKVERATARPVEVYDRTSQKVVSRRQAFAKRTEHRSNGKKKEPSPQDAAMVIQKTFRDHMSRRCQALHSLRDLAVAKSKLREIRSLFSNFSYRHRISKDAEERQRFTEKIIVLLLTVDAIEGADFLVRSAKRSMASELEAVLEVVDPQPSRDLGPRPRKFDLPAGSFSTDMASGVADVIHMLDKEDGSGGIMSDFTL